MLILELHTNFFLYKVLNFLHNRFNKLLNPIIISLHSRINQIYAAFKIMNLEITKNMFVFLISINIQMQSSLSSFCLIKLLSQTSYIMFEFDFFNQLKTVLLALHFNLPQQCFLETNFRIRTCSQMVQDTNTFFNCVLS